MCSYWLYKTMTVHSHSWIFSTNSCCAFYSREIIINVRGDNFHMGLYFVFYNWQEATFFFSDHLIPFLTIILWNVSFLSDWYKDIYYFFIQIGIHVVFCDQGWQLRVWWTVVWQSWLHLWSALCTETSGTGLCGWGNPAQGMWPQTNQICQFAQHPCMEHYVSTSQCFWVPQVLPSFHPP